MQPQDRQGDGRKRRQTGAVQTPQVKITTIIVTSLVLYLSFAIWNLSVYYNYLDCGWNRFDLCVDLSCLLVSLDMALRYREAVRRRTKKTVSDQTSAVEQNDIKENISQHSGTSKWLSVLALWTGIGGAILGLLALFEKFGSTCSCSGLSIGFNMLMGLSAAVNGNSLKQFGAIMMNSSPGAFNMPGHPMAQRTGEEEEELVERPGATTTTGTNQQRS